MTYHANPQQLHTLIDELVEQIRKEKEEKCDLDHGFEDAFIGLFCTFDNKDEFIKGAVDYLDKILSSEEGKGTDLHSVYDILLTVFNPIIHLSEDKQTDQKKLFEKFLEVIKESNSTILKASIIVFLDCLGYQQEDITFIQTKIQEFIIELNAADQIALLDCITKFHEVNIGLLLSPLQKVFTTQQIIGSFLKHGSPLVGGILVQLDQCILVASEEYDHQTIMQLMCNLGLFDQLEDYLAKSLQLKKISAARFGQIIFHAVELDPSNELFFFLRDRFCHLQIFHQALIVFLIEANNRHLELTEFITQFTKRYPGVPLISKFIHPQADVDLFDRTIAYLVDDFSIKPKTLSEADLTSLRTHPLIEGEPALLNKLSTSLEDRDAISFSPEEFNYLIMCYEHEDLGVRLQQSLQNRQVTPRQAIQFIRPLLKNFHLVEDMQLFVEKVVKHLFLTRPISCEAYITICMFIFEIKNSRHYSTYPSMTMVNFSLENYDDHQAFKELTDLVMQDHRKKITQLRIFLSNTLHGNNFDSAFFEENKFLLRLIFRQIIHLLVNSHKISTIDELLNLYFDSYIKKVEANHKRSHEEITPEPFIFTEQPKLIAQNAANVGYPKITYLDGDQAIQIFFSPTNPLNLLQNALVAYGDAATYSPEFAEGPAIIAQCRDWFDSYYNGDEQQTDDIDDIRLISILIVLCQEDYVSHELSSSAKNKLTALFASQEWMVRSLFLLAQLIDCLPLRNLDGLFELVNRTAPDTHPESFEQQVLENPCQVTQVALVMMIYLQRVAKSEQHIDLSIFFMKLGLFTPEAVDRAIGLSVKFSFTPMILICEYFKDYLAHPAITQLARNYLLSTANNAKITEVALRNPSFCPNVLMSQGQDLPPEPLLNQLVDRRQSTKLERLIVSFFENYHTRPVISSNTEFVVVMDFLLDHYESTVVNFRSILSKIFSCMLPPNAFFDFISCAIQRDCTNRVSSYGYTHAGTEESKSDGPFSYFNILMGILNQNQQQIFRVSNTQYEFAKKLVEMIHNPDERSLFSKKFMFIVSILSKNSYIFMNLNEFYLGLARTIYQLAESSDNPQYLIPALFFLIQSRRIAPLYVEKVHLEKSCSSFIAALGCQPVSEHFRSEHGIKYFLAILKNNLENDPNVDNTDLTDYERKILTLMINFYMLINDKPLSDESTQDPAWPLFCKIIFFVIAKLDLRNRDCTTESIFIVFESALPLLTSFQPTVKDDIDYFIEDMTKDQNSVQQVLARLPLPVRAFLSAQGVSNDTIAGFLEGSDVDSVVKQLRGFYEESETAEIDSDSLPATPPSGHYQNANALIFSPQARTPERTVTNEPPPVIGIPGWN